ncbi:hypothetical protein [Pseudonocardia sp. HH130630-07]|uniref:hypothetical protein n=1 Tax=Pseudonocardia sp. HH130630-07 TaxID=1690815 RepID=UPI000AE52238|nr:hypothetical protein [Pseudonocardia sp. HH130630-07]
MTARLEALLAGLPDPTTARNGGKVFTRRYTTVDTGAAVTLVCADRRVLWLTDRLAGHAYTVAGPGPGWRVQLDVVDERILAPLAWAFAGAPVRATDPDIAIRHLHTGRWDAFSADRDRTLILADPDQGVVRVLTTDSTAGHRWGPQLVRQAMTAQLRAAGAVHAHAAAVVVSGIGVLIAGLRASGKTTTVLAALRLLAADLVADHRVLLARDPDTSRGGGLVGYPWPAPVTVRSGALLGHPQLRTLLGAPDPRAQMTGHSVTVDPAQNAVLLAGGRLRARVRPRLMLWPQLALDRSPHTAPGPPIARGEVRARLTRTRLFLIDPGRGPNEPTDDWLTDPTPPTEAGRMGQAFRTVVEDLAAVDCHRLYVTPDPVGIARQITALLPTAPLRAVS